MDADDTRLGETRDEGAPGEKTERLERELAHTRDLLARTEEDNRRLMKQLPNLVEIGVELAKTETVDDLCRRAVVLGRDLLGFDRLGLWFRTDVKEVITGSYGVDKNGEVRDEREMRVTLDPKFPDGRILLGSEPFALAGEEAVIDGRGEPVGRGSQLFAALWDGEKVIGHVSADNSIGRRPIISRQIGLLRLFGTVIGSLYSRKLIYMENSRLIDDLQGALGKIKTLHGLIPICASCKKVRDDKGYWRQIESYVKDRSEADFSHGICPECADRLYPDLEAEPDGGGSPPPPASDTGDVT